MQQELSIFNWTEDEISNYREKLILIKSYIDKPINEENFQELYKTYFLIIDKIPLPTVLLNAECLLRGRPNKGDIFNEEWQISYNSRNADIIELGRFNRPEEPVFYAAVPTENENADVTITASLECYKDLVENPILTGKHDITIGQWNLTQQFYVVNLCYDKRFLKHNESHGRSIETFFQNLKKDFIPSSIDFIKEFWEFFSMLASDKAEAKQNHFLTTAFFSALKMYYWHTKKEIVHGIIYPSTMTENVGLNVVLTKEAVDKYLKLDKVFVKRFIKDTGHKKLYHCIRCSDVADVKNNQFELSYFF